MRGVWGRKINLQAQGQAYRGRLSDEDAWEVSALFAHFLPSFESAMSREKATELRAKFARGAFDTELLEKTRTKYGGLEWRHFRFLTSLGVEGVVHTAPNSESEVLRPQAAEADELKQYQCKVAVDKLYPRLAGEHCA